MENKMAPITGGIKGLPDLGLEQKMAKKGVITKTQQDVNEYLKEVVKEKEQKEIDDRLNSI